jgi:hypothetical protein
MFNNNRVIFVTAKVGNVAMRFAAYPNAMFAVGI